LWKWGAGPEEMLYKDQPKFIKFALENVKKLIGNESPTRFHKQEWAWNKSL
jgi:hypothetical protein